jgi:hypothetical protein
VLGIWLLEVGMRVSVFCACGPAFCGFDGPNISSSSTDYKSYAIAWIQRHCTCWQNRETALQLFEVTLPLFMCFNLLSK